MNEKVYIFSCSEQESKLIETLATYIDGVDSLFRKGIILMGVLLKARKSGNRLAIINEDNKILDIIDV